MPLSGGGLSGKKYKAVQRRHFRDLPPVSAEYEQDIIPYQKSFWEQYRIQLLIWAVGLVVNMTPCFLASTNLTSTQDTWGMGPTVLFTLCVMPFVAYLPIYWYGRYTKEREIMASFEVDPEFQIEHEDQ